MLYTHFVQSITGKVLHYDSLARERTDTTSVLSPAHYGLANQIKSVGLYERVLQFIVAKVPEGPINFVDVGCAGGLFLLAAQAIDGYHCGVAPRFNVRGISIDPRERSETERNVGCPVSYPDEAAAEWAGWADVVTLMNVLEHVSGPFELLCQLKRILKPGGLLLIDVPNNAVVSRRGSLLHRWPELDLGEHINHFVPSTLDRLLIRAGFSPAKRFLGMYKGVESLTITPGLRGTTRWLVSSAVMLATMSRVQLFPHDYGLQGDNLSLRLAPTTFMGYPKGAQENSAPRAQRWQYLIDQSETMPIDLPPTLDSFPSGFHSRPELNSSI